MYMLSLLEPQTIQDWLAAAVAATTAIVLIVKKFRSLWRNRNAPKP
ncbi:MAG: hypothetical protein Q8R28_05000 [Dehalococcoidia bacterium]|nr:hypothetical protein [Dehalococcoidia bacterium]